MATEKKKLVLKKKIPEPIFEPKPKSKRPDVAKKKKEAKLYNQTVIKMTLQSSLKKEEKGFIQAIKTRVSKFSQRYVMATIALNLFIREKIETCESLKKLEFPDFWNCTFIRQLMLGTKPPKGVKGATKPIPELVEFFDKYPDLCCSLERDLGDSNIYVSGAIRLSTNIKNHLRMNLPRMIKKYIYDCSELSKNEAIQAVKYILGYTQEKITDENILKRIKKLQTYLGQDQVTKKFMEQDKSLPNLLKVFIFVNQALESKELKTYKILPMASIKSHYISLDKLSFVPILAEVRKIKEIEDKAEREKARQALPNMEQFFNIQKIKRKKDFTGTIDTDGVQINFHFQKLKETKKESNSHKDLTDKRILGNDPGRNNILMFVEQVEPGKFKFYRLTRAQFYKESGVKNANLKNQKWMSKIQSTMDKLSKYSTKSIDTNSFLKFIKCYLENYNDLWIEKTLQKYSKLRFGLYCGKKRVFAKFFNKIKNKDDPREIIIAYGNGQFAPGGKGELSVPVKRAYKETKVRFKTELVDEFRSTIVNWKTDTQLHKVLKVGKDGQVVSVRGLLWYSTNDHKGKYVNRDENAAINILRCYVGPRPDILNRGQPALPKIKPKYLGS